MATMPTPHPPDGTHPTAHANGHWDIRVPKAALFLILPYLVSQGAQIFGSVKQGNAAEATTKNVETQQQVTASLEKMAKETQDFIKLTTEQNRLTTDQIKFMHQQLVALNNRVAELEKVKKP